MEVEARHLIPFSSQLIDINRNYPMMNSNVTNQAAPSSHVNPQFLGRDNSNIINPYAATSTFNLPDDQQKQFSYMSYQPNNQMMMCNDQYSSAAALVQAKASINTDNNSALTYMSRKRSRDNSTTVDNTEVVYNDTTFQKMNNNNNNIPIQYSSSVVLGEDLTPQIHQYQFDVDTLISQHFKKIRLELEERQKQKTRLLVSSILSEGLMMKKLREKEEQLYKMGKINQALHEKVKNLYLENQLWRDLAQSSEATANSLRTNLEQVLSLHVDHRTSHAEDDVESCCGSTNGCTGDHNADDDDIEERVGCYGDGHRMCKMCGERESSVLILPCRHLCLCSGCGGGSQAVKACPVCNSSMNATLHVNMS